MKVEMPRNPIKEVAVLLAHQMSDEQRLKEENLHPTREEEIREYGKYLRDKIYREKHDIHLLLSYVEQYKMLKIGEYLKWIRE